MLRIYEQVVLNHFAENKQMLFIAGPRQVGKTTLAKSLSAHFDHFYYLNFDIESDRQLIMQGSAAVVEKFSLHALYKKKPLLVFDEIHKYKHWKQFLKGFYDEHQSKIHILVTGSAKLNIFQKGGDSLMGRYLLCRMHPLSIGELLSQPSHDKIILPPQKLSAEKLNRLIQFGGFPDPYVKKNNRFSTQWHRLRRQQLFLEDIRSLKQVQDIPHIEMLGTLLRAQAGQQVNYTNLANALRISTDTVIRWIHILQEFYYCFRIQPWYKNVKRSLIKEPKIYLWDWSDIRDPGAKLENMVASHLHKAVHFWTDVGFGDFGLYYLRDKEKNEVDFLVTRDEIPWFLVETKSSDKNALSKNLRYFQNQIKAEHVFQIAFNKPFVDADCFARNEPVIVPALTLLSQLV